MYIDRMREKKPNTKAPFGWGLTGGLWEVLREVLGEVLGEVFQAFLFRNLLIIRQLENETGGLG